MSASRASVPLPKILVVDDESVSRQFVSTSLAGLCEIALASSGTEALEIIDREAPFDMVLSDVEMPEMTGHDLARLLRRHPKGMVVPFIFLTARVSEEDEKIGFNLGAADFIRKPISAQILVARVKTHLDLKQSRDRIRDYNLRLEERVAIRTRELSFTQDVTILSLASLAETRDNETGNHIRRTQAYVRHLGDVLAASGPYAESLDEETLILIEKSAPLHDIGKVGVPDAVLLKPGKLTDEEFEIIKLHTVHGQKALETAEGGAGTTSFLRYAKEIAYGHHEKWDGSGYPRGLAKEDIPLSARLMAVADVYDALITKRVYKPAFPHQKAVAIVLDGKGSHFDPLIVDAFIEALPLFQKTAAQFSDD